MTFLFLRSIPVICIKCITTVASCRWTISLTIHISHRLSVRVDIAPLSRIPNTDKTAGSSDVDPQKLQMLPRARRSHMTKQVNETFLWSDARTVLAFLLLGEKPRCYISILTLSPQNISRCDIFLLSSFMLSDRSDFLQFGSPKDVENVNLP